MAFNKNVPLITNQIAADLIALNANWEFLEWISTIGNVAFPATAVPSADANTLDDYEEGYHTVTITCSTSGSYTMDAAQDTIAYTKVGRKVTGQGTIVVTGETTPNGTLRVSLPFTSAALTENSDIVVGNASLSAHGGTIANGISARVDPGNAYFTLYNVADDGTGTEITHAEVDTGWLIRIGFSYIAA